MGFLYILTDHRGHFLTDPLGLFLNVFVDVLLWSVSFFRWPSSVLSKSPDWLFPATSICFLKGRIS
jgi:hypothetical protein